MKQVLPCPNCKRFAGWWQALKGVTSRRHYYADGEELSTTIKEEEKKHCTKCDSDISHCVVDGK